MDSRELRQAFIQFFVDKGHHIVESASLVPDNDPTLLFTNAGMVQFKEALALRENRGFTRAVSCQRCIRAGGKHNDLDNVGYTARHHTFFEMLGNFSFGDYFKKEAIAYAWEFLTRVIGLPRESLWVTVYKDDDEAERIWLEDIGFDPNRITRLEDNFWTMGDTGPCGPCSEIFYDHGPEVPGGPPGSPDEDQDRYVEIWNLVFTQYEREADGTLTPLDKPSVDTGLGLERLSAILQGVHNNFDIDLFKALRKKAAELLDCKNPDEPSLNVIADHLRSAAFLIADGVLPSNNGRGYVMRRIIRRALRHGQTRLQSREPFFHQLVDTLVDEMGENNPQLVSHQDQIKRILLKEEQQFDLTLAQGMHMLMNAIKDLGGNQIPSEVVFKLYDTYGFPTDLTEDIARERKLTLDMDGFHRQMQLQKERARAASRFSEEEIPKLNLDTETTFMGYDTLMCDSTILALIRDGSEETSCQAGEKCLLVTDRTPFYAESGGQVGDTGRFTGNGVTVDVQDTVKNGNITVHKIQVIEGRISVGDTLTGEVDAQLRNATRLNHSATHLMHAALRQVLGDHVKQRGSLVEPDRLRFDFSHFEKVTSKELRLIERQVNEQIRLNSDIQTEVTSLEEAREKGAMALFGEKYAENVRVLTMGNGYSIELCGGTHARRTGDIGVFRIISEEGIAAGVRRIEAMTGERAIDRIETLESTLSETVSLLRTDETSAVDKLQQLIDRNRKLEKEVDRLNMKLASGAGSDLADSVIDLGDARLIVNQMQDTNPKTLPDTIDRLKNKVGTGIVVLASVNNEKVSLIAGVTKDLTDKVNASELVNYVAGQIGGRGGGRPDMAQAGGGDVVNLPSALESVTDFVKEKLG